jgi:hypothetical protein
MMSQLTIDHPHTLKKWHVITYPEIEHYATNAKLQNNKEKRDRSQYFV